MLLKKQLKANYSKAWLNKDQHSHLENNREYVACIFKELTEKWFNNSPFSHFEGYLFGIQEEEINTNYWKKKRGKNELNPNHTLCHTQKELVAIQHIIAACLKLSAPFCLPVQHNKTCKNNLPKYDNKKQQQQAGNPFARKIN